MSGDDASRGCASGGAIAGEGAVAGGDVVNGGGSASSSVAIVRPPLASTHAKDVAQSKLVMQPAATFEKQAEDLRTRAQAEELKLEQPWPLDMVLGETLERQCQQSGADPSAWIVDLIRKCTHPALPPVMVAEAC